MQGRGLGDAIANLRRLLNGNEVDLPHFLRGVFATEMPVMLDDLRIAMAHLFPDLAFRRAAQKTLRAEVVP